MNIEVLTNQPPSEGYACKFVDPTKAPGDPDFDKSVEDLVEEAERGGPNIESAPRPDPDDIESGEKPEARVEP